MPKKPTKNKSTLHPAEQYVRDVLDEKFLTCKWTKLACQRHLDDLEHGKERGLYFDPGAGQHAIDFFKFLHHSKGEWAGGVFELEPWEQFILWVVFGWKNQSGFRRFRTAYLSLSRKNGKGLSLDTIVPTPSGWTTIGDIKVGDILLDENRSECNVTFITPVMEDHQCYKVFFSNGEVVKADSEHLWQTTSNGVEGVYNTEQIKNTLDWNHKIQEISIVSIEEIESVPVRCLQVDSHSSLFLVGKSMIPTHNTTLLAGIGLYLLVADGEPGAEVFSSATKLDQAIISHSEATRMVKRSPYLNKIVKVFKNNLNIEGTASKFEPLGKDSDSCDGLNIHGALVDELHAHKTRDMWDVLETATGARRQSLQVAITTAGFDRQTICWELNEYLEKILKGTAKDDSFFGIIYSLDEGDDWREEKNWCLSGDTLIYARINKGITVSTLQSLLTCYTTDNIELWDGRNWVKLLGYSESSRSDAGQFRIELRSGEKISCTAHHQWPTNRGKIRADELKIGDVISTTTLPEPEVKKAIGISEQVGWLAGLYLAEGSKSFNKNGGHQRIQLHGHKKEMEPWKARINPIVESFGGTCHTHIYNNSGILTIESKVIISLIDLYIGGDSSVSKYLKPAIWRQDNIFLKEFVLGYLEGDGHHDEKNGRYRLGFCRNYRLASGLRTLSARLGARLIVKPTFGFGFGGRKPAFRGSWIFKNNKRANVDYGKIVGIRKSSARKFYHIGVDNEDGLFALASGVLTHNSKANPNLNISVKLDDLRNKARKAREMPSALNNFLRKHMNVWVQQSSRWIDIELWDKNYAYDIEEEELHGRMCYGGLDLSSVSDLTAWVLAFPDPADNERVDVLCRFWCPESRLTDRSNRYRHDYEAWHRDGFLSVTPGDAVDYEEVKAKIIDDAKIFNLDSMNIDRLFQGYQLSMELSKELSPYGKQERVTTMGMGFMSMAPPMLELEKRLLKHKINHGNNPVLRWMADNLAVEEDAAGNKKPSKSASQGKIDGIVSLLMALDRGMRKTIGKSKYESEDLLLL